MLSRLIDLFLGDDSSNSSTPSQASRPASSTPWADRVDGASVATADSAPTCVYDCNRDARTLAHRLGKGGEGSVYPLRSNPDVLVKIYHPSLRDSKRAAMMREKIDAMLTAKALRGNARFAWPRALVFDENNRWLGYAMRRVEGVQMQTLCQPQLVAERIPHWSRAHVIACAAKFIDLIHAAHRRGVILGDINPANFLIDPETCEVRAIDCDSFQCRSGTRFFPCPVGVPMLLAPELLQGDYGRVRRTPEQELFSVAVMLFRMFMLGLHPYSRTYGQDPVANLKSGKCALGIGSGNRLPQGPWYNIWSHLPYRFKELFIRTFHDGHANPAARATLDEWRDALKRYAWDLKKGRLDPRLIPDAPKSSSYKGENTVCATPAAAL